MPHFFFHTRDNAVVIKDDIGIDLPDLEAVKVVAARSLAELALDVLPGAIQRTLGVDVEDEQKQAVLTTELVFKVVVLAG